MALADELKREAKKYETVKTAELEWTDRIKLDHLILFLKEYIQNIYPWAKNPKPMIWSSIISGQNPPNWK